MLCNHTGLTKETRQTYIEACETLKGKGSWWISSVISGCSQSQAFSASSSFHLGAIAPTNLGERRRSSFSQGDYIQVPWGQALLSLQEPFEQQPHVKVAQVATIAYKNEELLAEGWCWTAQSRPPQHSDGNLPH